MSYSTPFLLALVVFSTGPCFSQNTKDDRSDAGTELVTVHGYILDAMCGEALAKKQKDVMEKAAKHTRTCGLAEACAASGYGVFTEGRWVKFDAEGNTLAKAALEKSTKERGLLFSVTGRMKDGLLAVEAIAALEPEEAEKDAPSRQE